MDDATELAPLAGSERVELLDVLRGFALFGILLVNMQVYSAPLQLWLSDVHWWPGPLERAARLLVSFFAQGKFYTLFSILFGLGLFLQMERAAARGVRPTGFVTRRLGWLLAIGLLHAFLIWMGDILVVYAVVGLLVIPFRKRAPKTLAIWIAVLLLLPLLIFAIPVFVVDYPGPQEEDLQQEIESSRAAYTSGDVEHIMQQRAEDVLSIWKFSSLSAPSFLGLFLCGLVLARTRLFQDIERHLPLVRRSFPWLLLLGVSGNLVMVVAMEIAPSPLSPIAWVGQVGATFGAPALALSYVSTIVLLAQRTAWRRRLAPLAAVGQMALTNYLLQSLVCTAIFNGYGWVGLYGKVSTLTGIGLTLVIYVLQIRASGLWLRRFRFGPAEWLWRSLTYRRLQPLRVE